MSAMKSLSRTTKTPEKKVGEANRMLLKGGEKAITVKTESIVPHRITF